MSAVEQTMQSATDLVDVGSLEQIPVGQARCVVVDDLELAIFRFRDGRVFAIDNRCPHRRGPLSEGVAGVDHASGVEAVICPLHAYKFSLRDGRGLDTELQARVYRTEVRGGRVFVSVSEDGREI